MKLTNSIREAFINSAINDVPQVDYDEQANKLGMAAIRAKFAQAFPGADYDKACEAGWLNEQGIGTPGSLRNIYAHAPDYGFLRDECPEVYKELEKIAELNRRQTTRTQELRQKLHCVAYAVTTRKALAAALPEFEKYLPADLEKAAQNLPVVQNVVSDFIKAGWPKNKAKDAVAA